MLAIFKECYGVLRRNLMVGGIGAVIGFLLGIAAPNLGAFISFGPIVAVLICLLPCLAPLLLLRRANGMSRPAVQAGEDPVAPS